MRLVAEGELEEWPGVGGAVRGVPPSDRGLLYGDGLFATALVRSGRVVFLGRHLDRFRRGADLLGIRFPRGEALASFLHEAPERLGLRMGILRWMLTRGGGGRGYSPAGAGPPLLLVSGHAAAARGPASGIRVGVVGSRVWSQDPLLRWKTSSQLTRVLARAEADARGWHEGLLLNDAGHLTEATAANLFWWEQDRLRTPSVDCGLLPGVTRGVILEIARSAGIECGEMAGTGPDALRRAGGIFLTQSTRGVVPVGELDGCPVPIPPQTQRVADLLEAAIRSDLAGDHGPG